MTSSADQSATRAAGHPPRVLIIEDHPDARAVTDLLLRRWGCRTACAASVAQAIPLLDWAPDAILLDLMLPDGRGTRLLRRVRELGLAVRVAVVTSANDPELLEEVGALSPDGFFAKPVEWGRLRAWLGAEAS